MRNKVRVFSTAPNSPYLPTHLRMGEVLQQETAQFCGLRDIVGCVLQSETGVASNEMTQKEAPVSGA